MALNPALALPITTLYAGLLAILFIILSVRIPPLRYQAKTGIGLGEGQDTPLIRAVRVHGNFAEHVPMALIVIALVEANGFGPWTHLLGAALFLGRISFSIGLTRSSGPSLFRFCGMLSAWGVILAGGIICLLQVFSVI